MSDRIDILHIFFILNVYWCPHVPNTCSDAPRCVCVCEIGCGLSSTYIKASEAAAEERPIGSTQTHLLEEVSRDIGVWSCWWINGEKDPFFFVRITPGNKSFKRERALKHGQTTLSPSLCLPCSSPLGDATTSAPPLRKKTIRRTRLTFTRTLYPLSGIREPLCAVPFVGATMALLMGCSVSGGADSVPPLCAWPKAKLCSNQSQRELHTGCMGGGGGRQWSRMTTKNFPRKRHADGASGGGGGDVGGNMYLIWLE